MKITIWALHFAEYASLLAAALKGHADIQLVVYADNATNELGHEFRSLISQNGVSVEVLHRPRTPLDVLRNAGTLIRLTRRFRPDVLHIQEDGRDELVLALACMGKVPLALTVHDPAPHSGLDAQRYRFSRGRLYHKLLRRRASCAITHGLALCNELARITPGLEGRICAIAHGPLGLSCAPPGSRARPGTPVRLLFFGRIHAYKGLRYFVEAIQSLRDEGHDVLGVVAGRGSDLDNYHAQMIEAGCFEIRERYIDSEEVIELFSNSDVVVLPYTDATQSGVAAMALGYGIPVVATTVGSIPEFVRHGVNGHLVPPKDSAALVQSIKQVLYSPGEYERLSQNAIAMRDGELSWGRIAELTMSCYRDRCLDNTFVS